MSDIDYTDTAKHFHQKLDNLQFEQTLDEATFLLVEEEPLDFAGTVSRRMLVMQLGLILNRTLVLRPPDEPPYAEFYQPISSYSFEDIAEYPIQDVSFDIEQFDKVVRFDFDTFWENKRLRSYFYPWAPDEFSSLKCARLIFDGETLSRLHVTEDVDRLVEETKTRIGFSDPVIGLHVGRGSEVAAAPDAPLVMLLAQVDAIREEHGVDRVLVTGDVDGELAAMPQGQGFEFITTDSEPGGPMDTLLEMELLSACDWVVGRVTADLPRIAAARIGMRTFRCDRHRLVSNNPERRRLGRLFAKK